MFSQDQLTYIILIFIILGFILYSSSFYKKSDTTNNEVVVEANKNDIKINSNKNEIKIESIVIQSIILGVVLAGLTVFVVEHFGNFSYKLWSTPSGYQKSPYPSFTSNVPGESKVKIFYTSPFGTKIEESGTKHTIAYVQINGLEYKDKIDFYISATFKDFVYILIFSAVYSIIIIFFRKNKITIT